MTPEEFDLIEKEFTRDTGIIEKEFNKVVWGTNWIN